jgi:hypothetical protein
MARSRRNPSKTTWMLLIGASIGVAGLVYFMSDAKAAPSITSDAALADWRSDSMEGQVARPLLIKADGGNVRITKSVADSMVARGKAYWESAYQGSLREGVSPYTGGFKATKNTPK